MPIKGETDRHLEESYHPTLRVVCRLWKGEARQGNNAGRDLNNRFRFEAKDPALLGVFKEAYEGDRPEQVRIYLPYPDVDGNFPTWMEAHTAAGFKHRCDGETIVEKMVSTRLENGKVSHRKHSASDPCPYSDNVDGCPSCHRVGRLFFHVRELYHAGFTQAGMLSITGKNDIIAFTQELATLQAKYGRLDSSPFSSPQTLGFIPWVLSRVQTEIFRPVIEKKQGQGGKSSYVDTGGRTRGTTWLVSIKPDPEWLEGLMRHWEEMARRQIMTLNQQESISLPTNAIHALPAAAFTEMEPEPEFNTLGETPAWKKFEQLLEVANDPGQIERAKRWALKVGSGQFKQISQFTGYEIAIARATEAAMTRLQTEPAFSEVEAELVAEPEMNPSELAALLQLTPAYSEKIFSIANSVELETIDSQLDSFLIGWASLQKDVEGLPCFGGPSDARDFFTGRNFGAIADQRVKVQAWVETVQSMMANH